MTRMGMDVEAVEQVGRELQSRAGDLGSLVARIDRAVRQLPSVWEGKDANQFITEWWPGHKATLLGLQEAVQGLGQSALNNAGEQRQVSGAPGAGAVGSVNFVSGDTQREVQGFAQAPPNATDPPPVATAAPPVESWASRVVGTGVDIDGRYGNQCVDVVRHYTQTIFPDKNSYSLIPGVESAKDIYASASGQYFDKIPAGVIPQPGDILCQGPTPTNKYGHVAVVESVDAAGVHVVQQNGFRNDQPAYRGVVSPSDAQTQGYLRPRV